MKLQAALAVATLACSWQDEPSPSPNIAPRVRVLGTDMRFVEGPVWLETESALIFSDIPSKVLMRWTEASGVTRWRTVEHPNGNALDVDGTLLTCSHGDRAILAHIGEDRVDTAAPPFEPIIESFESKRFNSPNDLAVQSDGVIWFTDPPWGLVDQTEGRELPGNWVFRFDRSSGDLRPVLKDRAMPNGIALSPDEKHLYVADTGAHRSHPDGEFSEHTATLSAYALENGDLRSTEPVWRVETVCDGMCVAEDGRIFATGRKGLTIWSYEGKPLGEIELPEQPANVCIGGEDGDTLFVTARTSLYAVDGAL